MWMFLIGHGSLCSHVPLTLWLTPLTCCVLTNGSLNLFAPSLRLPRSRAVLFRYVSSLWSSAPFTTRVHSACMLLLRIGSFMLDASSSSMVRSISMLAL